MTKISNHRLGILLVIGSTLAWSTAGFFTRLIPLDLWTLVLWRGIFSALGMILFLGWNQGNQGLQTLWRLDWSGWAFVVVATAGMLLYITSLRLTSVAHVCIIYASVPFIAAGLAWVLVREKPSTNTILASLTALLGVVFMVGLGREGHWSGDLLALAMTLCMALSMVIARRYQAIPTMQAVCLSALLSAVAALAFAPWQMPSYQNLLYLALFGLVNSGLGMALFALGSKLIPAAHTALIGALDAPLALVWVWLAFGEAPSNATLIGGGIVTIAVGTHIVIGHIQARSSSVPSPSPSSPTHTSKRTPCASGSEVE